MTSGKGVADALESLRWPGMWRLAVKHRRTAVDEVLRDPVPLVERRVVMPAHHRPCRHGASVLMRTSQFSLFPSVFGLSPLMATMDAASSATTWLATSSTAGTLPAGMTAAPAASAKT